MSSVQPLGLFAALASALVWGTGDFTGGYASRRNASVFVLLLATTTGLVIFAVAAILLKDPVPPSPTIRWAALAGISGALGLVAFYRALALGPAAVVAPAAAVVGAAVPVFVTFVSVGLPPTLQLFGIILGLVGISLVSSGALTKGLSIEPFILAVLGGLGFGGFFSFMALVEPGYILIPLAVTRVSELVVSGALFLLQRPSLPRQRATPLPFVAGALDAGGNLFFLLSIQTLRLDLASLISSMYPAATVLLARLFQSEHTTRLQALGLAFCLVALGLIAIA